MSWELPVVCMKLQVVRIRGKIDNQYSFCHVVAILASWHFKTLQIESKEVIMAECIRKY
jgi:hypothetical protein